MTKAEVVDTPLNANSSIDTLLITKLYIPRPRPALITRPRLSNRLTEGLTHKLILISAPPGFGKTTILSDWISQSAFPFMWVSLDSRDNESARFWIYFITAIQRLNPKIGRQAIEWLQSSSSVPMETIITSLLNEIDSFSEPFAIVLEDYHTINSISIHQNISFLLDHMPDNMHLIITSRSDPQLPLAQLRALNEMIEIRSEDLRFTSEETAAFLNQTMGLNLTGEQIASLKSRTEGWIAGLQLAAISLQGHIDSSSFISSFKGSHRFILDYLLEQVLQRQTTCVQQFLLDTSILDHFTAQMCDAVTERIDSQNILEELERANLFLVSLDDEREWYRYHHLFKDALYSRLKSTQPSRAMGLHQNAAGWFEAHGMFIDAIEHALASADWERAVRLIEQESLPVTNQNKAQTVLGWVGKLPDPSFLSHPRLLIVKALALMYIRRFDESQKCLETVEQNLTTSSESPTEKIRTILGEAAGMRSVLARLLGDIPTCVTYAHKALDQIPESSLLLRSSAHPNAALAFLISGDMRTPSEESLLISNRAVQELNYRYIKLRSFRLLGWYYALKGSLKKAAETYHQIIQVVNDPEELKNVFGSPGYYFGMGDLLLEWNDLEAAQKQIETGMKLIEGTDAVDADILFLGYQTAARLKYAYQDYKGAIEIQKEFGKLAEAYCYFPALISRCAAQQAWFELMDGNSTAANKWIEKSGLTIEDTPYYPKEAEYLVFARILIAQGKTSQAYYLLERWLEDAEMKERIRSVIAILNLQALALGAAKNIEEALKKIAKALSLAEMEGYIRIFVDEGDAMADLLILAASRAILPDYIRQIIEAFPQERKDLPRQTFDLDQPAAILVEPLSPREIEVLGLIGSGASNQTIANELVISVATVKRHISNIYGKLMVNSRTQAIAKAREIGLN